MRLTRSPSASLVHGPHSAWARSVCSCSFWFPINVRYLSLYTHHRIPQRIPPATSYICTHYQPPRCAPAMPLTALDYDLAILNSNISCQGCNVSRLGDKIQFHAETVASPAQRTRLTLTQQCADDLTGTLHFDPAEVLAYMDRAASASIDPGALARMHAVADAAHDAYPYNLMRAMLAMHSDPRRYLFVRVLFSIDGERDYSNNFACTATLVRDGDDLALQPVWNGSWWENLALGRDGGFSFPDGPGTAFISVLRPGARIDDAFRVAMEMFVSRRMMLHEAEFVSAFLTLGRRERSASRSDPKPMLALFNGCTYLATTPMHFFISHMHALLEQEYPADLVRHVLRQVARTGLDRLLQPPSPQLVDVFLLAVVKIVLRLEGAYRPDLNGEDIALRFDALDVAGKDGDAPLLAGGDCEDMAQAVISVLCSMRRLFQRDRQCQREFPWLAPLFAPAQALLWEAHIARGTCLQDSTEENHTFVVCVHKAGEGCELRAVETVAAQFVVPDATTDATIQSLRMFAPEAHVLRRKEAAVTYQHVLILGRFVAMEFCWHGGTFGLHLGAATFFRYYKTFCVTDCGDPAVLCAFLAECRSLRKQQERILLLITREAALQYYPELFKLHGNRKGAWKSVGGGPGERSVVSGPDALKLIQSKEAPPAGAEDQLVLYDGQYWQWSPPLVAAARVDMMAYAEFSALFVRHVLMPCYQEDTARNAAWTRRYLQLHHDGDPPVLHAENFAGQLLCGVGELPPGAKTVQKQIAFRPPPPQRGQLQDAMAEVDRVIAHLSGCMLASPPAGWEAVEPAARCQDACPRSDGCLVQMIAEVTGKVKRAQCGLVRTYISALLGEIEATLQSFVRAPNRRDLVGLYQALVQLRLQIGRLLARAR